MQEISLRKKPFMVVSPTIAASEAMAISICWIPLRVHHCNLLHLVVYIFPAAAESNTTVVVSVQIGSAAAAVVVQDTTNNFFQIHVVVRSLVKVTG